MMVSSGSGEEKLVVIGFSSSGEVSHSVVVLVTSMSLV